MTVHEILSLKGHTVYMISPEASLADAVRSLASHNVASLVVCLDDSPDQMVGIITERDLIRCLAKGRTNLVDTPVSAIMSTNLITAAPNDMVEDLMGVMTDQRIRHLPVVVEGRLSGIVSIGDLLKAQHDHLAVENRFMRDYIQGQ